METHWLSQTFSFAAEFRPGLNLKTVPKKAGPLLADTVAAIQANGSAQFAEAVATQILLEKIKIRNASQVVLTRPKDLSIEATIALVRRHINQPYRKKSPRLPQLIIYAIYQCLVVHVGRYKGCQLEKLGRMKSADRKADTIGDIVLTKDSNAVEAVEIKQQPIKFVHVSEAIDKVRALSVRRYYMLSTAGVAEGDIEEIDFRKLKFLKQNGCEIIINGVLDSLSYYLRLLPDTNEFVFNYAQLVETDEDTNYEHRESWNLACQKI